MTAAPADAMPLACPFCGSKPRHIKDDNYGDCMIFCAGDDIVGNCPAEPCVHMAKDKFAEATAAWNRRPLVDEAAVAFIAEKLFDALISGTRFAIASAETRDWWIKTTRAALSAADKTSIQTL